MKYRTETSETDKKVQTTICTFLRCGTRRAVEKKRTPMDKKLENPVSVTSSTVNNHILDFNASARILMSSPEKRKLPAPIFSEDENSDDDANTFGTNDTSPSITHLKNRRMMLIVKPPPQNDTESGSLVINKGDEVSKISGNTSCCADSHGKSNKGMQRMQSLSPSKKSLEENELSEAKEEKKINYDYLKVMREFYVNITHSNNLKTLISNSDHEMLQKFFAMEVNYQYTCIKLFLWKADWYNAFKYVKQIGLKLSEQEVKEMYNYLKDHGFIESNYLEEKTAKLLSFLKLNDLKEIQKSFKFPHPGSGSKETIIARLLKNCKTQGTLFGAKNTEDVLRQRIKQKMGCCFQLSARCRNCLFHVYILNVFSDSSLVNIKDYFGNVYYSKVVFPSYQTEDYKIFKTKDDFVRFAAASRMRCELEAAIEKKNVNTILEICQQAFTRLQSIQHETGFHCDVSMPPHLEQYTACARYISIITSGSQHLISKHHDHVMSWFEYLIKQDYSKHKRGHWYCQLVLIYANYCKEYEKAAQFLIEVIQNTEFFSEVQVHELAYRGKMLDKKTYKLAKSYHDQITSFSPRSCDRTWPQRVIECNCLSSNEPGRRRTYEYRCDNGDIMYMNVEERALKLYFSLGYTLGVHCEGSLIRALFCLYFWDIIYEHYVEATFITKVQHAPLDMNTKYFYLNREKRIKKRLKEIDTTWTEETLKNFLFQKWEEHSHESSLCQLNLDVENAEYLFDLLISFGRNIIAKIFERLVRNFRVYHSGFPDLIVWNVQERKAMFVEIKSENDKLSIKQKLWLNYLMDIGANVEVCYVLDKGSRRSLALEKLKSK